MTIYKNDGTATYDLNKGQYILTEDYMMAKLENLPESLKDNLTEFCELVSDIIYAMLLEHSNTYKDTRYYLAQESNKPHIVNSMILLAKSLYVRKTVDSLFSDESYLEDNELSLVPKLVKVDARNKGIYRTSTITIPQHILNKSVLGVDY